MPSLMASLEALSLPASPGSPSPQRGPGPERFAWHLGPRPGGLRVDVLECLETPRGWREGERLPIKALPEPGSPAWAALGRGEQEAIGALRAWSRNPAGLPVALLAALEGHGRVSWGEASDYQGKRVALSRELCALEVRESGSGWRLALTQRPGQAPGRESVRMRLEGDRLLFTAFGPVHRALDALLGEGKDLDPRLIPDLAHRLAAWMGRLAPHLPILTDLLPDPPIPEGRPDRGLLVWVRGGGPRLEVRLRMQPGPRLPLCLPGEGARHAVAGDPAARIRLSRDLLLERRRVDQVQEVLPPSARALGDPLAWRIEGREAVAGFLSALAGMGSRIRIQGLPGLVPALPHPVTEQDLALSLRRTAAGLELRGTLRGRDLGGLLPALKAGGRFLDLGGQVLDLSGLLGHRLRQLAAWGEGGSEAAVRMPLTAAPLLGELGLTSAMPEAPQSPPDSFRGELRPYQIEGFRWMARLLDGGLGACLADDMGLGKTVQTAALLVHRGASGPALVVCPTSVCLNWIAELERFAPSLRVGLLGDGGRALDGLGSGLGGLGPGCVLIASYGLLLSQAQSLQAVVWGTVVLDEAHAIKNPETRRAQASRGLRSGARLALTGTPVENRPEELASLLGWMLPGALDRFMGADPETLRLLAAPFLLRRSKAQVLTELPPRTSLTVRVELEAEEAAFHRDLLARSRDEALAGGALHILALLMKLRRACAHPRLVDPGYGGPGAKLDLLVDRLETLKGEGHRCLVFSQFTDLLDLVQERMERAGITHRRLDGTMSATSRQRAADAFQSGEAEVFLLSLRAGGTGLNLTAADDVFHLDPWWNPAVEDQASDRAHRMGRTRPVTVHRLIAAGTVEERVLAMHARKRAMVEALLEGRSQASSLDRETLEALLG